LLCPAIGLPPELGFARQNRPFRMQPINIT
jgi:hypothetical protein